LESRVGDLERKINGLERALESVLRRLAALEAQTIPQPAATAANPPPPVLEVTQGAAVTASAVAATSLHPGAIALELADRGSPEVLVLVGRTFLVIGGAFLVRAITDRNYLLPGAGVALGLAFAASWGWFAARAAAAGQTRNAGFHAASAMLVGFPLIVETGTRLGLLSPPMASLSLLAFTLLLLTVAGRHGLRAVAWASMLAAVTAAALLPDGAAGSAAPLFVLLFLAVAAAALSEWRDWHGLRWPVAVLLDLLLVRYATGAMALATPQDRLAVVPWLAAAAWSAALFHFAAPALRVFLLGRGAGAFEAVQPLLVAAAALFAIGHTSGPGQQAAAGACVLAAGLLALFGAERLSRDQPRVRDAVIAGAVGAVLTVEGGAVLGAAALISLLWGALGLAFALLGRKRLPWLWWSLGLALTVAACARAGVLTALFDALFGAGAQPAVAAWAVLAIAVTAALAVSSHRDTSSGVTAALSLGQLLPGALGLLAAVVFAALALFPSLGASPAALALLRTLTLSAGTIGAAVAYRRTRAPELAWLAFGLLGLSLLKLLVQDLPQGHPLTLVAAFSAVGLVITALPRLLRR